MIFQNREDFIANFDQKTVCVGFIFPVAIRWKMVDHNPPVLLCAGKILLEPLNLRAVFRAPLGLP